MASYLEQLASSFWSVLAFLSVIYFRTISDLWRTAKYELHWDTEFFRWVIQGPVRRLVALKPKELNGYDAGRYLEDWCSGVGLLWAFLFGIQNHCSTLIFHSDYSDSNVLSTVTGRNSDCECGGIQRSLVLPNVFYIISRESVLVPREPGFLFIRLSICLNSGVNGNVRKHSVKGEILLVVTGIRSCRLPAAAKRVFRGSVCCCTRQPHLCCVFN